MGDTTHQAGRRQAAQEVELDRRQGERRQAVRAAVDLWVEELRGNELYFRRTSNLSTGGMYFEQSLPHAVGTQVELKFTLPGHDEVVEAQAEVVNTPEGGEGLGMGLRFVHLDPVHQGLLNRFIKKQLEKSKLSASS